MGINLADACGEQQDAGLEVFFVGGLDGLVNVARGDRDRASDGATGNHALEVGGIGAACGEDFGLPLDLVLVGGFFHEFDHAVVADDGGVHELDGDAFAEGGALFLGRGAGDIVGDGGIEAEAKVWLNGEGGGLGPAEADFFLHGEAGVEIEGGLALGFFQFAQGLDEEEYGGAVVERFDVDAITEFDEGTVAGDAIADGDDLVELFFGEACVDEIVFDLRDAIAFIGLHDVDRLAAHDAHDVLFAVDDDALGGECFRVESTESVEAHEALVIDVRDDEADLVHVGGGHDFFLGGFSFFQGDDIAHVIDGNFIGEVLDFGEDELADFFFEAWGTGSLAAACE